MKSLFAVAAMLAGSLFIRSVFAAIVIPIEIVDGNNVADLTIGKMTLKAHIDTGGHGTVGISPQAVATLQVRFTGAVTSRTDGSGAQFQQREFIIASLKLGGHVFRNVKGYERLQAASGNFGGAPFDALIGRDFLTLYTVVVDYPQKRFELHDRWDGRNVCGIPTAAMRDNAVGLWLTEVVTDHGRLSFAWDTGAKGASFIQERIVTERGLPLSDEVYRTQKFIIGSRNIGPLELVPLPLNGVADIDGLIGISVFASHRVCFDFARHLVSLR